jgi:hypothetical protein
MTASQRYFEALMAYGDEFFDKDQFCQAYEQYQLAASIGNLTEPSASHAVEAQLVCYPATPTIEIGTATVTTTAPTDVPTVYP